MKMRIMYIEYKGQNLTGDARIGRVQFSKSMKSLRYANKLFISLKGSGFKSNYYDDETGEEYWISGCKKDGTDRLYNENSTIYIDEDVQEEYWREIRNMPEMIGTLRIN